MAQWNFLTPIGRGEIPPAYEAKELGNADLLLLERAWMEVWRFDAPPRPLFSTLNIRLGGMVMTRFWDLLKDSTLFQGFITLALVGTTCYLWIMGYEVPQELWTADTIVLGFFFGSKAQQMAVRQRR